MLWCSPDPEMPKLRTVPAPTPLELLDLSQLIILAKNALPHAAPGDQKRVQERKILVLVLRVLETFTLEQWSLPTSWGKTINMSYS